MKSILHIVFFVVLFMFSMPMVYSQNGDEAADLLMDYFSEHSEVNIGVLYEEIQEMMYKPLSINRADSATLAQSHLFTDVQLENFLRYRKFNGELMSLYEFKFIEGFTQEFVQLIAPFIRLEMREKSPLSKRKAPLKLHFITYYTTLIQKADGYRKRGDSSYYLGAAFKNNFRIRGRKGRLRFGLSGEKDAGEIYGFTKKTFGFPSYSGFLSWEMKHLRIVLGNYKISFGQGISQSSVQSFSSILNNTHNLKSTILRPSASTSEGLDYRGLAVKYDMRSWELSFYASFRRLSATIDRVGQKVFIRSFREDGIFNTEKDVDIFKNTLAQNYGFNLQKRFRSFKCGVNLTYSVWDKDYLTERSELHKLYLDGNRKQLFGGFYFSGVFNKINYYHESSFDRNFHYAALSGVSYMLHPGSNVEIGVWNFSKKYANRNTAYHLSSPGYGDELGFFYLFNSEFHPRVTLYFRGSFYEKKWLQYSLDNPTTYSRQQLALLIRLTDDLQLNVRAKNLYSTKEERIFKTKKLIPVRQMQLSIRLKVKVNKMLFLKTNYVFQKYQSSTALAGSLLSQDLSCRFDKLPLQIDFRFALFDSGGWANRFYTYENDLLYVFAIPAYYDKGSRIYLKFRYALNEKIMLSAKYAHTSFINKNTIGSGADRIHGNQKSTISLLLRVKV